MAKNHKKPVESDRAEATKVTRITATDSASSATKKTKRAKQPVTVHQKRKNPFAAIGKYFAGAWYELKQVRWPNRKATWSMTAAMLAFTAFFAVLILLLDALFKYLFELILG